LRKLKIKLFIRNGGRQHGEGGADEPGEAADRSGQRPGDALEDDGEVFQEVHPEAGQITGHHRAEVHFAVHGSLHGRLESGVPHLRQSPAKGAVQDHGHSGAWQLGVEFRSPFN